MYNEGMNDTPKPLTDLKAADYNPRAITEHDAQALDNSMFEFGDLSGVVNNTATGNLVGGHQRVKQLLKRPEAHIQYTQKFPQPDTLGTVALGYIVVDGTDVRLPYREVSWPNDTQDVDDNGMPLVDAAGQPVMFSAKERAANVAANAIGGTFVDTMLAKIVEQLKKTNAKLLELTGLTQARVSTLLDQFGSKQESDEEGDVEAIDPTVPPKSTKGTIYQLGDHRLMCGDSASPADVDRLMNGQRAGMVFTDPPYNVGYVGGGGQTREGIQNDKMSSTQFINLLNLWCANLVRVCDGAIYICMSPKELGALKAAFEAQGGHWHDYIIWVKDHFTLGGGDFQHQYEPILYGWPERVSNKYDTGERDRTDVWEDISAVKTDFDGTHTRIKVQGFEIVIEGKVAGKIKRKKIQSDIWRFNKPSASPEHPTMKPTALCAEAIKNTSKMGDIILDLFGGSGSTLIAAEETQRLCYMMELDEQYVDVIRKRYARLMGHEDNWEAVTPAIEQAAPEQPHAAPTPVV